jgi:hypothetical protein
MFAVLTQFAIGDMMLACLQRTRAARHCVLSAHSGGEHEAIQWMQPARMQAGAVQREHKREWPRAFIVSASRCSCFWRESASPPPSSPSTSSSSFSGACPCSAFAASSMLSWKSMTLKGGGLSGLAQCASAMCVAAGTSGAALPTVCSSAYLMSSRSSGHGDVMVLIVTVLRFTNARRSSRDTSCAIW